MAKPPKITSDGSTVDMVELRGDPSRPENETFRVKTPWGSVDVVRATDTPQPDYWVHINVNHPEHGAFVPGGQRPGQMVAARIDRLDKDASEMDTGDFGHPETYHVAVRIGRRKESGVAK